MSTRRRRVWTEFLLCVLSTFTIWAFGFVVPDLYVDFEANVRPVRPCVIRIGPESRSETIGVRLGQSLAVWATYRWVRMVVCAFLTAIVTLVATVKRLEPVREIVLLSTIGVCLLWAALNLAGFLAVLREPPIP